MHMNDQKYSENKLKEAINGLVVARDDNEALLHSLGRLSFAISEGSVEEAYKALEAGETTNWLAAEHGLTATASAEEGGLGLVLSGPADLRTFIVEAVNRYQTELEGIGVRGTASFSLFNNALVAVNVAECGDTYDNVVDMLTAKMLELATPKA